MIQVYAAGNSNFSANGDAVLFPVSCLIETELGGAWEMELVSPLDDEGRYKHITEGAVISAPSFTSETELFRVYEVIRTQTQVTAYARPIFFDAADDVMLLDNRPTDKTGQAALNWMMDGTAYSGTSDITDVHSAEYIRKNLIEALIGNDENSFVNRWGGEPSFSNRTITLNQRLGKDRGVIIAYRKNLDQIDERVSLEDTITRIIPVAYNGRTLGSANPWVDSPKILQYPKIFGRVVKFENLKLASDVSGEPAEGDQVYDTEAELRTAMAAACVKMFDEGADDPTLTITISMTDLSQTEEYKNYAQLETIRLGDTVHCYHSVLGIQTDARVVALDWDACRNCVDKITLGTIKQTIFDRATLAINQVSNVFDTSGEIMADHIRGALDLMKTQLKFQQSIADPQDVRAIMFEDRNPESQMFGALCIGSQGIQISHELDQDGEWIWGTAMDSNTIYASQMVSGILSDKNGTNYWNLDTGDFRLSSGADIDGSGRTLSEYVTDVASQASGFLLYLSSEYMGVTPDTDGTVTDCYTDIAAYYGDTDVTAQCTYSVALSTTVTGTFNQNTRRLTITRLTGNQGYAKIRATYNSVISVMKTFTISRIAEGAAGSSYMLEASDEIIRITDQYGQPSVSSVTFNAYAFRGDTMAREDFSGRFRIERTEDGGSYETIYESSEDEHECEYQCAGILTDSDYAALTDEDDVGILTGDVLDTGVKVTLFAPGGFEEPIAIKNIVYVREAQALTTEQCFNILTNNGEARGIIRSGNQLYISMDYLSSGTVRTGLLKSANNSNYWNLDTGDMKLSAGTQIEGIGTIEGMQSSISANASGLSAEVGRATKEEGTLRSSISANAEEISSEVSRATKAEGNLSSRITQTEKDIKMRITAEDAESLIEASADAIRLKTTTLTWEAENSSLSKTGVLRTTSDAGKSTERSSRLSGGRLRFYKQETNVGGLAPTAWGNNESYEGQMFYCTNSGKYIALARQTTAGGAFDAIFIVNNGLAAYSEPAIIHASATKVTGTMQIDGAVNIGGSLTAGGALTVGGNITSNGTLFTLKDIKFQREVSGTSEHLRIGAVTVIGTSEFLSGYTFQVGGSTRVNNRLSVGGATTLTTLSAGNTSIAGTLTTTGKATIGGAADITGNTSIGGTLTVTGNTSLGGTLTTAGNATIKGSTLKLKNVNIQQLTEESTNFIRIGSKTAIGTADFLTDYYLHVGGAARVNGKLSVGGTSTLGGNTSITGTLTTTGKATIGGAAEIKGNASISGTLTTTGAATVGGTLTVSGDTITFGSKKQTIKQVKDTDEDEGEAFYTKISNDVVIGTSSTKYNFVSKPRLYVDGRLSAGMSYLSGVQTGAISCSTITGSSNLTMSGTATFSKKLTVKATQSVFGTAQPGEILTDEIAITANGNLKVNGNIQQSSDERLKNIMEWPEEIEQVILELEPICFTWKGGSGEHHYGLGAQTVRRCFEEHGLDPEGFAPHDAEDDSYGIMYSELAPMMLRVIQKDHERIRELEDRIDRLEALVTKLTGGD